MQNADCGMKHKANNLNSEFGRLRSESFGGQGMRLPSPPLHYRQADIEPNLTSSPSPCPIEEEGKAGDDVC
jgi:hypothetical protein